jgi:excisionase family DNA binding protein
MDGVAVTLFILQRGLCMSSAPAFSIPATLDPSALLTRQEAAAYLGIAPQTLAVWATNNRYHLPFIKVGRCVRYRRRDLDRFLEQRIVGTAGV